jgi:hypothetical protein
MGDWELAQMPFFGPLAARHVAVTCTMLGKDERGVREMQGVKTGENDLENEKVGRISFPMSSLFATRNVIVSHFFSRWCSLFLA